MRFFPIPVQEALQNLLVFFEVLALLLVDLEFSLNVVKRNSGLLVEFCGVFESEDKTTDLLFQHATPPCDGIFPVSGRISAPKSFFCEGIKA
jgi:hypothetical protein